MLEGPKDERQPMCAMRDVGHSNRGASVFGTGEEPLNPDLLRALWSRVTVALYLLLSDYGGKGPLCGLLLAGPGLGTLETLNISSFSPSAEFMCFNHSVLRRKVVGLAVFVGAMSLPCK